MRIGVIGLGNMGTAMLGGMISKGIAVGNEILGADNAKEIRERAAQEFKIQVTGDNREAAGYAEVLILAIKPQYLGEVIEQIRGDVREETIVLSIVAGKTIAWMEAQFEKPIRLARTMPNTPALVGEGCSGACRNAKVTEKEMALCLKLLGSFGMVEEVPEHLMDAVVGVSGSSPAYVFMLIEAMADGAVAAGMPRNQAYRFAAQAVLGSARMVLETGKHPGELKDMVCSPGGTTIEAVKVLEKRGFRSAVIEAINACVNKSKDL